MATSKSNTRNMKNSATTNVKGMKEETIYFNDTVPAHVLESMKENRKLRNRWFQVMPGFTGTWEVKNIRIMDAGKVTDGAFALELQHATNGRRAVLHGTIFMNSLMYEKGFDEMNKDFRDQFGHLEIPDQMKGTFFLHKKDAVDASQTVPYVNEVMLSEHLDNEGNLLIPKEIVVKGAVTYEDSFQPTYKKVAHPLVGNRYYFGWPVLEAYIREQKTAELNDDTEVDIKVTKSDVLDLWDSKEFPKIKAILGKKSSFDVLNKDYSNYRYWFTTLVVTF
jgi:hypothetical protein